MPIFWPIFSPSTFQQVAVPILYCLLAAGQHFDSSFTVFSFSFRFVLLGFVSCFPFSLFICLVVATFDCFGHNICHCWCSCCCCFCCCCCWCVRAAAQALLLCICLYGRERNLQSAFWQGNNNIKHQKKHPKKNPKISKNWRQQKRFRLEGILKNIYIS